MRGQALITVIMIMVIALAFGITISTRFIKNLHSVSESDFAVRALNVAEAAAERILLFDVGELGDFINNDSCGTNCVLTIIGSDGVVSTANVSLSFLGNSSSNYTFFASQPSVVQVDLQSYAGSSVDVCWDDNDASVYGSYLKTTGGDYLIDAYAYNSIVPYDSANGFSSSISANGFSNCFSVSMDSTPVGLRIRPLYKDVSITIIPQSGYPLPSQGILIEASGVTETANSEVQVIRSNAFMPALFDYVLYQRSDIVPLSN